MKTQLLCFLAILATGSAIASESCKDEYARGNKVGEAYGEMLGVMEGMIYGHALYAKPGSFCLKGTPKEQVQAIAAIFQKAVENDGFTMEDLPSKESSLAFMRKYFPCSKSSQLGVQHDR